LTTVSLNQAFNLIKRGDAQTARRLISNTLKDDPHCEIAWTLLFYCYDTPEKQQYCLQKVLEINPYNDKARKVLCSLSSPTHAAPDIAYSPFVSDTVDHKPDDHPQKISNPASKIRSQDLPTHETLMNPALQALKELGGSATIEALYNKVIEIADIPDELIEISPDELIEISPDELIENSHDELIENNHDPGMGSQLKIKDRRAWSRSYLEKLGITENSTDNEWTLNRDGHQKGKANQLTASSITTEQAQETASPGELDQGHTWRDELISTLNKMEASAFESLILRMLQESALIQDEDSGRSGEGGMNGSGIMRLGGLISFHALIQCKCYQGSVTPGEVRDFREAMAGQAYKGLLVTTGDFTMEAVKEATRDGATAIDLIDGDLLVDKLKELGLGVTTQIVEVEKVIIDKEWLLGSKY